MQPDETPILVDVRGGAWNAYGNPDTLRSHYLYQVLADMGGVSDSVPEGLYNFNVTVVDNRPVATLTPAV